MSQMFGQKLIDRWEKDRSSQNPSAETLSEYETTKRSMFLCSHWSTGQSHLMYLKRIMDAWDAWDWLDTLYVVIRSTQTHTVRVWMSLGSSVTWVSEGLPCENTVNLLTEKATLKWFTVSFQESAASSRSSLALTVQQVQNTWTSNRYFPSVRFWLLSVCVLLYFWVEWIWTQLGHCAQREENVGKDCSNNSPVLYISRKC